MPWELTSILDAEIVEEGLQKLDPINTLNKEIDSLSCDHHRVSALESIFYMRNALLRDTDWAGMAHSMEIRVPLVDIVLIDHLAPLMVESQKPDKRAMANFAWGTVPKEILHRPKTCFSFPIKEWGGGQPIDSQIDFRNWAMVVYRNAQKYLPSKQSISELVLKPKTGHENSDA
jgi:asparagine synthase (glutamine-hydrolysing)